MIQTKAFQCATYYEKALKQNIRAEGHFKVCIKHSCISILFQLIRHFTALSLVKQDI